MGEHDLTAVDAVGQGDGLFVQSVEDLGLWDGALLFALDANDPAALAGEDGDVGAGLSIGIYMGAQPNADQLLLLLRPTPCDPRVLPVIDKLGQEFHVGFVARCVG